jgi:hypothetical protein
LLRPDYGVSQGVWKSGDYAGLNMDMTFTIAAMQNGV